MTLARRSRCCSTSAIGLHSTFWTLLPVADPRRRRDGDDDVADDVGRDGLGAGRQGRRRLGRAEQLPPGRRLARDRPDGRDPRVVPAAPGARTELAQQQFVDGLHAALLVERGHHLRRRRSSRSSLVKPVSPRRTAARSGEPRRRASPPLVERDPRPRGSYRGTTTRDRGRRRVEPILYRTSHRSAISTRCARRAGRAATRIQRSNGRDASGLAAASSYFAGIATRSRARRRRAGAPPRGRSRGPIVSPVGAAARRGNAQPDRADAELQPRRPDDRPRLGALASAAEAADGPDFGRPVRQRIPRKRPSAYRARKRRPPAAAPGASSRGSPIL